ncbi:hypothetical protein MKX72_20200 [Priestia sp. FSL R5-0597]|uniref:hypothetical protein n=1 Tax=Priestia sp. FSL R5-0597 TaxID=2921580 RepID=UPI0030F75B13
MKNFECQCGKTSENEILIPKSVVFMGNGKWHSMYAEKGELICLSCLEEEAQHIKECY